MPEYPDGLLEVRDLDVFYGRRSARKQAIDHATFTIGRGEVIGLIGETGSGKSTIARAILGLVSVRSGSVVFEGTALNDLTDRQWKSFRRSRSIQYVFQDPLRSLDPDFTLEQSIAEPLLARGGLSRADIAERVRDYLARVQLTENLLDRLPGQVSGGQRQRVAIARALITEPKLLILDEPVSALDSANRVQILELMQRLAGPSVSLLFISHDLGSVAGITDQVIVLYRGQVVEIDRTDTVINRPRHPYTRLLVGSAPTLTTGSSDRAWRERLRAELA